MEITQNKEIKKLQTNKLIKTLFDIQTKEEYCVFFSFSGHVNWMNFAISQTKKNYNKILCSKECIDLNSIESINHAIKELKRFIH